MVRIRVAVFIPYPRETEKDYYDCCEGEEGVCFCLFFCG